MARGTLGKGGGGTLGVVVLGAGPPGKRGRGRAGPAGSCSSVAAGGPVPVPEPVAEPGSPAPGSMAERDAAGAGGNEAERGLDSPDSDSDSENGGASGESEMDFLRNLLSRTLGLGSEKPEKVLDELTLDGVSRFMQSEKCRNVVCIVGAGISTSAGIPDFRSPGTGLYANLQSYNLPYPEAIFEINYFKQHPEPFFALARELYPGQFKPTVCHYFIRLLKEKGLLLRCYTQNIDTLERVAGLDQEDLVEAHGTFFTSHCLGSSCKKKYTLDWMKEKIFSTVTPKCDKCQSLVKPDIVFFGENLPPRFFTLMQSDFQKVDLLIIMGTSLQVQPFASLVSRVPTNTPRLLINKEKTGQSDPFMSLMGLSTGMDFDSEKAYRDVAWLGECDQGCTALAELLGWKNELEALVKKEHSAIDAKSGQAGEAGASPSLPPAGATASPSSPPAKPGSSPEKESDAGNKAE
ncbi:NAD-dependent protein deacetylase sirtuin-2 isoform X2 [Chelonia mydas]|uniref:NAD-dependent protein deacetylase sirtuin-2 isoform X2 n=2 Tax=Chelonia mydas TaxID=8469 RepID=UPI001CA8BBDD|nr:NAD-dependent protein deacetylase sirtuin-2 isoform X2 [Chelonia mydas]